MNQVADIKNKVVVITGANSGIGFEAALNFACRGAQVGMICRNASRGEQALARIKQLSGNNDIQLFIADFSQLKSIPTLASQVTAVYPKIDVLCNNAGSVCREHIVTDEGFEWTLAVNHLSGFLLTKLLLPNLVDAGKSNPARVVFTSSTGHKNSAIDFDNLNLEGEFTILKAYGRSKLMNLLTARELHKLHRKDNIIASSFHPGVVNTGIWKHAGKFVDFMRIIVSPFVLNSKQGADTLIWLATSSDDLSLSANGRYFEKRHLVEIAPFATDESAKKLWRTSLALVKPFLSKS